MGGANAKAATSQELQSFDLEDGCGADDLMDSQFPWFHIVQWCAEERGANIVWRWDISTIKARVSRVTESEASFQRDCAIEYIDDLPYFSLDEDHFFLEWASDLLEQVETLKMLRFHLVPAKIKEEVFWRRYFAGLKRVITSEFFIDPDAKDYSHLQQNNGANGVVSNHNTGATASASAAAQAQTQPQTSQFQHPPQPVSPPPNNSYQQQHLQSVPHIPGDGQNHTNTYGMMTADQQRAAQYNTPDRTMIQSPVVENTDAARKRRDDDISDILAQLPETKKAMLYFQEGDNLRGMKEMRQVMGSDVFQHSKNCIHDARERATLSTLPFSKWKKNAMSRSDGFRCTVEYPGDAAGYHHQQAAFTTSNFRYGSFYHGFNPPKPNVFNASPLKVYAVNTAKMNV